MEVRDSLSNRLDLISAFPVARKWLLLVRRSVISSLLVLFLFVPHLGGAQEARIKKIHSIPGNTLKIIQAAMPEFQKRGLELDKCLITVVEDGPFFVVIFDDPNRPPYLVGRAPNFPTFEVELSKSSLKVTRAYYAR